MQSTVRYDASDCEVNSCPPEVFYVTRPPKGLWHPLPGFSKRNSLYPCKFLYLLPVYRYGHPLSIHNKLSTIKLHMTSLWRHIVSAPSKMCMHWKHTWKFAKINFSPKNRRHMRFSPDFWLNIYDFTNPSTILFDDSSYLNDTPKFHLIYLKRCVKYVKTIN